MKKSKLMMPERMKSGKCVKIWSKKFIIPHHQLKDFPSNVWNFNIPCIFFLGQIGIKNEYHVA